MEKFTKSFPTRRDFVIYDYRCCSTPIALVTAAAVLSFIFLKSLLGDYSSYSYASQVWNHTTSIPCDCDKDAIVTPLTFEWNKIIPSTDLVWHVCGKQRECARLELPMDHLHFVEDKIAVALVRIPATVHNQYYRGPILVNPGGPGKSGVAFADRMGDAFQRVVGHEYDIVGFDPRGVGATTPKVSNFINDIERELWNAEAPPLINISNLPDTLPILYSRADIFGQLALSRSKRAAEYVSTAAVARDMLNITNAFGFEKLKYWGFSYGTVIGATFAAMFPDHVERLIIDGVVDYSDYYSGLWANNLFDTDKILDYIFEACATAGPQNCPLYEPTSSQVKSRFEIAFNSIGQRPIPVVIFNDTDPGGSLYDILNYETVKAILFASINSPFDGLIESFFDALAGLEKGNPEPMMRLVNLYKPAPTAKCGGGRQRSDVVPVQLLEGAFAVRCGESPLSGSENSPIEDLREYLEKIGKDSVFADLWSQVRVGCSGWRIKVKERYEGDFVNKTTAFPLLVIGNTLDPVTPHIGAKKASEGFHDSVLLTIDTPGHCSYASMSPEALRHVRNYFRDGILPPTGTICPIENKLFVKNDAAQIHPDHHDFGSKREERELLDLASVLAEGMHNVTWRGVAEGFYL